MSAIYSIATPVHLWLGRPSFNEQVAIRYLASLRWEQATRCYHNADCAKKLLLSMSIQECRIQRGPIGFSPGQHFQGLRNPEAC